MLFKSKNYPFGRFQILPLVGEGWKSYFKFTQSIGFWKHPTFVLGSYAKWTLRFIFVQIQEWLPEGKNFFSINDNGLTK